MFFFTFVHLHIALLNKLPLLPLTKICTSSSSRPGSVFLLLQVSCCCQTILATLYFYCLWTFWPLCNMLILLFEPSGHSKLLFRQAVLLPMTKLGLGPLLIQMQFLYSTQMCLWQHCSEGSTSYDDLVGKIMSPLMVLAMTNYEIVDGTGLTHCALAHGGGWDIWHHSGSLVGCTHVHINFDLNSYIWHYMWPMEKAQLLWL